MNNLKFFLTLAVLLLFASCTSSDDEPVVPQPDADVVFMSAGGTKMIYIDTGWAIDNPDEYPWCSAVITGSYLELTAVANMGSDSRRAVYTLSQGKSIKKIEAFQHPAAEIKLTVKPKTVAKNGGNIDVTVESNVPFEVLIPEKDQTWVRCSKSRGVSLHFEVSPNTEPTGRSTTVSLVDADGNILFTFVISQKGDQAPNVIYYTTVNGSKIIARGGFGGNFNILSHTYLDGRGTIVFDGNILQVEKNAFANSSYLVSMSLPDGITAIGTAAFANCLKLEEINIPEQTELISQEAFKGCAALTALTVPDNCKLGDRAFEGSGLESFMFPNRNEQHSVVSGLFYGCKNLKSVQLPEGVQSIGESAFSGCAGLRTINVPASLMEVKADAFKNCESLESLSFGPGVTFDDRCFEGMTGRIRMYPDSKKHLYALDGFKGTYEFPADANPEYLSSCTYFLEKEVRFAGKYASSDGRCIIVDGKLYAATLRDYDKKQYNFPKGIVKVMGHSITTKAYGNKNTTNLAYIFFADGLEEMGGAAFYADFRDGDGIYTGTYPLVRFPKSFKRFTGDDVLYSNVGWYAVFESLVPPELGTYHLFDKLFYDQGIPCKILVPEDAVDAYRAAWPQEASRIQAGGMDKFLWWTPYE